MKRTLVFLLLLPLLLAGCSAASREPYTVTVNAYNLTIDPVDRTITHGEDVYTYEIDGRSEHSTECKITYPNGSTYYETKTSGGGHSGWSEDYDEFRYISGDTLVQALESQAPRSGGGANIGVGLFLLALGTWHTLSPYSAWYVGWGWRYKDAEPSDAALFLTRIGGIAYILFGLFAFFIL